MIQDISEFVCTVLDLECYDSLAVQAKSKSFLDIVMLDGKATLTLSQGCPSLGERISNEKIRMLLQSAVDGLCRFCERYRVLLNELGRSYCRVITDADAVDLHPIVACNDFPSGGYFVRTSLIETICNLVGCNTDHVSTLIPENNIPDDVAVGGFAIELARLLEDPLEKWIIKCEAKIEALVPTRDEDFDVQGRDVFRKRSLRRRLVKLLSQHVAMLNLFKSHTEGASIVLTPQPNPLNTEVMESLIVDYADAETVEYCESRRDASVGRLEILQHLCKTTDLDSIPCFVAQQRTHLIEVLRAPPSVLTRRPGYATFDFRFNTLRIIILNTPRKIHELTVYQINEWKNSVGRSGIAQLCRFLEQSIGMLKKQKFPVKGFLATLRMVTPPRPTWTNGDKCDEVYLYTKSNLPMTSNQDAVMQLPASTEQILRLVSFVWELLAYGPTRDFYFTPGRVSAGFLREVVSLEKVNADYAAMQLKLWKQKCDIGKNYRMASNAIVQFRETDVEGHLRESFSRLGRWSLLDLMSVVSERHSRSFHSTQWKLVDAVNVTMQRNHPPTKENPVPISCHEFVGSILDVIEPLCVAMRSDVGVRPFARPHMLADIFRTIPAIRKWDGMSDELVITVDEVQASRSKSVRQILHSLSDQNSIVHYGRAPKAMAMGSKRVFRFNGPDLKTVLYGELL
jgi:hypothetical protein